MIAQTRESLGRIPAFMLYFFLGQTGFVRREPASTAAWIVGVLVVGAVLLGAPQKAEAVSCFSIFATCWHPQVDCNALCAAQEGGRCPVGDCKEGYYCLCDDGTK